MDKCIFCQIIEHKIPAQIVLENEEIIAFRDINPQAPVHILIIPKKHISSLIELNKNHDELIGQICRVAKELAKKESIDSSGFRLVVNTGPNAGQAVNHIHFHLLGGRKLKWPPG